MKTKTDTFGDTLARRAAQVQRGGARAAVLGVNDGLVSTLCLVVGMAATGADAKVVLTAGFAGLLAGSISMAAGEWISVKAQVELFEGVLGDVRHAIRKDRDRLTDDLAENFEDNGMDEATAGDAAEGVATDDKRLLAMYASQVIGINKEELGSPWVAAISSFLLFTVGSIVPLLPWIIGMHGWSGISVAIVLTGIGSLCVGAYTARSSGKNLAYGALRQLLIVIFAAAVTYGIGHIFGVATS